LAQPFFKRLFFIYSIYNKMSFSGYNTEPTNFAFEANKYADPHAKIAGVGCAGTNQGYLASQSAYVEPPYIIGGKKRMRSKRRSSKKYTGGNSGYEFTDIPIGPVAGPGAPYSEVRAYNTLGNYRDIFPPLFKGASLKGGKKHTQYGCNNKSHKHKSRGGSKRRSVRRSRSRSRSRSVKRTRGRSVKRSRSRRGGKKMTARRQWMMRGGMSSASDYTTGRDASQDQPYGNKAISFGQGLDSMLGPNESALASPPPFLPYNDCGKVMRV
jgi:hypothetical protein